MFVFVFGRVDLLPGPCALSPPNGSPNDTPFGFAKKNLPRWPCEHLSTHCVYSSHLWLYVPHERPETLLMTGDGARGAKAVTHDRHERFSYFNSASTGLQRGTQSGRQRANVHSLWSVLGYRGARRQYRKSGPFRSRSVRRFSGCGAAGQPPRGQPPSSEASKRAA